MLLNSIKSIPSFCQSFFFNFCLFFFLEKRIKKGKNRRCIYRGEAEKEVNYVDEKEGEEVSINFIY